MKECSIESKAFSKSAENKIASMSFSSVYSRISLIKRSKVNFNGLIMQLENFFGDNLVFPV